MNGLTKAQDGVARWMHALVFMCLNGVMSTFGVNTLPSNASRKIMVSIYFSWGGPRQQDHGSMNVHILSNPHVRQKRNEKKAFDRMKKKRN